MLCLNVDKANRAGTVHLTPGETMAYHIATIEILVNTDDEADAADCIAEAMRPILREFAPESSVIDWRYANTASEPQPHSGTGFEYA